MDKEQVIQTFWSSFGLPAYDEYAVPVDAVMPYITYGVSTGDLDEPLTLTASVWYRSSSWVEASLKSEEIAKAIGENGYLSYPIDHGYVWFTKGSPFSQRMGDPDDDLIKRVYLIINAEFLTAY